MDVHAGDMLDPGRQSGSTRFARLTRAPPSHMHSACFQQLIHIHHRNNIWLRLWNQKYLALAAETAETCQALLHKLNLWLRCAHGPIGFRCLIFALLQLQIHLSCIEIVVNLMLRWAPAKCQRAIGYQPSLRMDRV